MEGNRLDSTSSSRSEPVTAIAFLRSPRSLLALWVLVIALAVTCVVLFSRVQSAHERLDSACNQIQSFVPFVQGLNGSFGC